jgi:hypothetical protein
MPNVRLLPPTNVQQQKIIVNGRPYAAAPGAVLDAPDFDTAMLCANGFTRVAEVGPTSARPAKPFKGSHYVDTTVGAIIISDGATWRTVAGAAA